MCEKNLEILINENDSVKANGRFKWLQLIWNEVLLLQARERFKKKKETG